MSTLSQNSQNWSQKGSDTLSQKSHSPLGDETNETGSAGAVANRLSHYETGPPDAPGFVFTPEQLQYLQPWLAKLRATPGSVLLPAVESLHSPVKSGWLSAKERRALRVGLERVNKARQKRGETQTTEPPTSGVCFRA
jgi:hypothetical protein